MPFSRHVIRFKLRNTQTHKSKAKGCGYSKDWQHYPECKYSKVSWILKLVIKGKFRDWIKGNHLPTLTLCYWPVYPTSVFARHLLWAHKSSISMFPALTHFRIANISHGIALTALVPSAQEICWPHSLCPLVKILEKK